MKKRSLTDEQLAEVVNPLLDVIVKADELSRKPKMSKETRETLSQMSHLVKGSINILNDLPEPSTKVVRTILLMCLSKLLSLITDKAKHVDMEDIETIINEMKKISIG